VKSGTPGIPPHQRGHDRSGIPVIRYRSTGAPLRDHRGLRGLRHHDRQSARGALEDGSRYKRVDADQLGFKREVDPMGLLNPGKMRSFVPQTT